MWGGPGLEGAFGQLDLVDAGSLGWIADCLLIGILHNIQTGLSLIPEALAAVGVADIPAAIVTTIAVAANLRQSALTRGVGAVSISWSATALRTSHPSA